MHAERKRKALSRKYACHASGSLTMIIITMPATRIA